MPPPGRRVSNHPVLPWVNNASTAPVAAQMPKLVKNWSGGRSLGKNNRYLLDSAKKVAADLGVTPNKIDTQDLCEYMAASVFQHTYTGWQYLSRSINATLSGSATLAAHLAYYAELRAAMGLLAFGGIGVFDKRHVYVWTDKQTGHIISKECAFSTQGTGTHAATWVLLQNWANTQTAQNLVLDSVRSRGSSLRDWALGMGFPLGTAQLQASEIIRRWGLDLSDLDKDQQVRNEMTYQPYYRTPAAPSFGSVIEDWADHWDLFEPKKGSLCESLDGYLIRRVIHLMERRGIIRKWSKRETLAQSAHRAYAGGTDTEKAAWAEFIDYASFPQDPILFAHADLLPGDPPVFPGISARALLLLRMATAAAAALLEEEGATAKAAIARWSTEIGTLAGHWDLGETDFKSFQLWKDVEDALEDYAEGTKVEPESPYRGVRDLASPISVIAGLDRVFLWGISI